MMFMGIIEHGWNIYSPTFGLGGLCVTFGRGPMRILLFLPCACVLPQRWVDFRVVRVALCRNTPKALGGGGCCPLALTDYVFHCNMDVMWCAYWLWLL